MGGIEERSLPLDWIIPCSNAVGSCVGVEAANEADLRVEAHGLI